MCAEFCLDSKSHKFDREQDFLNYLSLNDYRKAIQLALAMEQPGRLLTLFKQIRSSPSSESALTGDLSVDEVIRSLGGSDLAKLLRFVRDWNVNAKTSAVAQTVLFAVTKLRSAESIMKAFTEEETLSSLAEPGQSVNIGSSLKEYIDALIPYTERHLSRLETLVQDSYMVDYVLAEMDGGMVDGDLGELNGMDIDEPSAY